MQAANLAVLILLLALAKGSSCLDLATFSTFSLSFLRSSKCFGGRCVVIVPRDLEDPLSLFDTSGITGAVLSSVCFSGILGTLTNIYVLGLYHDLVPLRLIPFDLLGHFYKSELASFRNLVLIWPDEKSLLKFLGQDNQEASWTGEHYMRLDGTPTNVTRRLVEDAIGLRLDTKLFLVTVEKSMEIFEIYGKSGGSTKVNLGFLSYQACQAA